MSRLPISTNPGPRKAAFQPGKLRGAGVTELSTTRQFRQHVPPNLLGEPDAARVSGHAQYPCCAIASTLWGTGGGEDLSARGAIAIAVVRPSRCRSAISTCHLASQSASHAVRTRRWRAVVTAVPRSPVPGGGAPRGRASHVTNVSQLKRRTKTNQDSLCLVVTVDDIINTRTWN